MLALFVAGRQFAFSLYLHKAEKENKRGKEHERERDAVSLVSPLKGYQYSCQGLTLMSSLTRNCLVGPSSEYKYGRGTQFNLQQVLSTALKREQTFKASSLSLGYQLPMLAFLSFFLSIVLNQEQDTKQRLKIRQITDKTY